MTDFLAAPRDASRRRRLPRPPQELSEMNVLVRTAAVLSTAAALLGAAPAWAQAQEAATPAAAAPSVTRDEVSIMVGHDIARDPAVAPVAAELDMAAFHRAIENALAGGEPLLDEAVARETSQALVMRIRSQLGQLPPDTQLPEVDRERAGLLVGAYVGARLQPIKEHLDLPVVIEAMKTTFAGGELALDETGLNRVRQAFAGRLRAQMEAETAAAAEANAARGEAFLAANKQEQGVFTTPSGLQYRVLRPGSGPRPMPGARVRVNYEGRLLDGTVFDSSYERGQPAEFGLDQVIAGWAEGVTLMPVGSKYRFWIPAELAYGRQAPPDIGPNQTLVFDVELQAILP
jgi:FKBP-type peptidyl-prolyl cis-trans isomerase FkpA